MPINERRRDDIATAVAAHDSANPNASLPRNAARPAVLNPVPPCFFVLITVTPMS